MKHFIFFCAFWAALLTSCSSQVPFYTADFECEHAHINVLLAPEECLASIYNYENDVVDAYTIVFLEDRCFQLIDSKGSTIYFQHLHDDTYRQHNELLGEYFSAIGTFKPLQ